MTHATAKQIVVMAIPKSATRGKPSHDPARSKGTPIRIPEIIPSAITTKDLGLFGGSRNRKKESATAVELGV